MATMTPLPQEFRDLLSLFNAEGLRYLLIGGWAVGFHGYKRYTGDIDFWIAVTPENADRLIQSLSKFIGVAPTKSSILEQRKTTEFGNAPLKVHIMCEIAGVDFDACYPNAVIAEWDGVKVPVIGAADLLKNKTATGRDKDKADVGYLKKLSQKTKRKKS